VFEILDCVEAQIVWMLKYAEEHDLPIERMDSLKHLMARTRVVLQDMERIDTLTLSIRKISPEGIILPKTVPTTVNTKRSPTTSYQNHCQVMLKSNSYGLG
jgi:hypothetical protein